MIEDDTILLLGAYEDGELSSREAFELERRLAADPELRATDARMRQAAQATRAALGAVQSPEGLKARITERFAAAERPPAQRRAPAWRPMATAAAVGLVVGGALGATSVYWSLGSRGGSARDAVLTAHLRALAAPQPFDIASSDKHVVKPWFNGRTTVAPEAPDFADQGFPLAGGRIDVVDGRSVPTLVYRKARHVISVTIVPGRAAPDAELEREGSTLERWRAGDLTYWAVSDLNAAELRRFASLFRARTAPAT